MTKKRNGLLIAGLILTVFNVLSKLSGFLRETVMAYYYGAGTVTDAYAISSMAITLLFSDITSSISVSYIPIYAKNRNDLSRMNRFTSVVINIFVLVVAALSLIALLNIKGFMNLFIRGNNDVVLDLAVQMAAIMVPFSAIYVIRYVLGAYLQAADVFWHVGGLTLIANVVLIAAVPLSVGHVMVLPYGYAASLVICTLIVIFLAYQHKFCYVPSLRISNTPFLQMTILAIPVFFGTFVNQLHDIVDRNFASLMGIGVISAVNYATKLNGLFSTIIVGSLATVLFPTLSRQGTDKDLAAFRNTSHSAYSLTTFLMLPVTAWILVFPREIVDLAFSRGAFDSVASEMTTLLLLGYAAGLPFLSLNQLLNYQYYALGDTKTPVGYAVVAIGLNIVLTFTLTFTVGYVGISLATSIGSLITTILLFRGLHKRMGSIFDKSILHRLSKTVGSTTIMAVVMLVLRATLHTVFPSSVLLLFFASIIGGSIYFGINVILKTEECKAITALVPFVFQKR